MDAVHLFGRRLRTLREAKGLTQQQLGELADLSFKYVGSVERGQENPSLKVISKLAVALEVELDQLFAIRHESTSSPQLKKELNSLLKEADTATLQQAVKLLRALLT